MESLDIDVIDPSLAPASKDRGAAQTPNLRAHGFVPIFTQLVPQSLPDGHLERCIGYYEALQASTLCKSQHAAQDKNSISDPILSILPQRRGYRGSLPRLRYKW